MIRPGVYRTKKAGSAIEEHGGVRMTHLIYWYLCFYENNTTVGMYGSSDPDYFDPFVRNVIRLKGELLEQHNSSISFFVLNASTKVNILFKGTIEGNELHLKYFHENKPAEVYEDVFEYIGMG
jgi:hypothetical protein